MALGRAAKIVGSVRPWWSISNYERSNRMTDVMDTPPGDQFNDMMHAAQCAMSAALAELVRVEADRGTSPSLVVAVPLGTLVAAGELLFEHFGSDSDLRLQEVAISILRGALRGINRPMGSDGTLGFPKPKF